MYGRLDNDRKVIADNYIEQINGESGYKLTNSIMNLIDTVTSGFTISNEDGEKNINLNASEQEELLLAVYENIKDEEDKRAFLNEVLENKTKLNSNIIETFESIAENIFEQDMNEETDSTDEVEEEKETELVDTPATTSDDTTTEETEEKETEEEKIEEAKPVEEIKEGPAITEYKKDTETLKEGLTKINDFINTYKTIENKIIDTDLNIVENYESLKNEIESLPETYPSNLKSELLTTLENKKNGVTITTVDLDKLKEENLSNEELMEFFNFEEELTKKEEEKTTLLTNIEKLTEEINLNKEKITSLEMEIDRLTSEKPHNYLGQIYSLQKEIQTLNKEIEDKTQTIESMNNDLNSLESNIADLTEMINNKNNFEFINTKIKEYLENEKNKVIEEKNNNQVEIEALKNEIEEIKANIESVRKEINDIEKIINMDLTTMNVTDEQKQTLATNLQNKKQELQSLLNQLQEKENSLANLENKNAGLDVIIEGFDNEIKYRDEYFAIVSQINELIDSKEVTEEKINSIKVNIENSTLEEELKQELNNKLEKTIESINSKTNDTKEIDKYINQAKTMEEDIKARENNINVYYEALKDINEINSLIKSGKTPEDEEIKTKIEAVNAKISPLPELLKKELEEYLNKALTMEITNIEKQPSKWQKWIAGAAGLAVGMGAVALIPTAGMAISLTFGALNLGVGLWRKHVAKKNAELKKENEITKIEEPNEKQKGVWAKFKKLMHDENFLRNTTWFLTGAVIGAGVMSAVNKFTSPSVETPPTDTITADKLQDPLSEIKIGENVEGFNVTQGHDSAAWAVNNVNSETLLGQYVNEGSVFQRFAVVNPDGSIGQIINTQGTTLSDVLANSGLTAEQIAVDVGKNGVSQAWISVEELLKGTGHVITEAAETVGRTL